MLVALPREHQARISSITNDPSRFERFALTGLLDTDHVAELDCDIADISYHANRLWTAPWPPSATTPALSKSRMPSYLPPGRRIGS
ncbi:MAG: hypothetical protein R2818_10650 [Flavobacteriales bacterium]